MSAFPVSYVWQQTAIYTSTHALSDMILYTKSEYKNGGANESGLGTRLGFRWIGACGCQTDQRADVPLTWPDVCTVSLLFTLLVATEA